MLLNRGFLLLWFVMGISTSLQAGNDPTRPPFMVKQAAKASNKPLKLSMILSDGKQRKAVINESLVVVSDFVDGAKVLRIDEDGVVVRRAGSNTKLTMPLAGIKQVGNDDE